MKRSDVLAMLAMLVLGASACRGPSEPPHDDHEGEAGHEEHDAHGEEGIVELDPEMLREIRVRTAPVERRALPAELETTGQVDFEQDRLAHVTPRISGRVEAVRADLGDQIEKGEVLALLDSIELGQARSEYLQARAQEELARQNFEREQGLFAERVASEKEMLAAKAAHVEALARARSAEETLRLYGLDESQIASTSLEDGGASLLPVRSPLAGRVVEKHVTVGELVTPERNLFTIADLAHVWIWIDVYERDLAKVHLEDDVTVTVDAHPGESFRGQVSYLGDQVEADTRTVRARIDVANAERKLRPGMFARIALSDPHTASTDVPSAVVPSEAVLRDGAESIVFVPLDDHRFARREVETGRRSGGYVEILAGLAAGEEVVIEGGFLLKSEAARESMGGGHSH